MPEATLVALRAEYARAKRAEQREPADARRREQAERLRRDYAAAKLAEYIKRVVDAAPPLTDEQRDRLAVLLTVGGAR